MANQLTVQLCRLFNRLLWVVFHGVVIITIITPSTPFPTTLPSTSPLITDINHIALSIVVNGNTNDTLLMKIDQLNRNCTVFVLWISDRIIKLNNRELIIVGALNRRINCKCINSKYIKYNVYYCTNNNNNNLI